MKRLSNYIAEHAKNETELFFEFCEAYTNGMITEDWKSVLSKIGNFFKGGGKAALNTLKTRWAEQHPDWAKEVEKLNDVSDAKDLQKKIDDRLAAIDKDDKLKDDHEKNAVKLEYLNVMLDTAKEKKFTDVEKNCTDKIAELTKNDNDAAKKAQAEMQGKTPEGEGDGQVTNSAVEVTQDSEVVSAVKKLGLNNEFTTAAQKIQGMIAAAATDTSSLSDEENYTSTMVTEANAADAAKIVKAFNDAKLGEHLALFFVLYQKFKNTKIEGIKINPDSIRALLSLYDAAKEEKVDPKQQEQNTGNTEGQA